MSTITIEKTKEHFGTPRLCAQSREFEAALLDTLPSLKAFAYSLVTNKSHVDDLVQETALKAWDKHSSFQPGTNIKAWLFTILRNQYFSSLRKSKREVEDPENVHSNGLATPPPQEFAVQATEVAGAIQALPKEQREALILIGACGHSYEEAASMSGCAIGTIKSRTSRARKNLGKIGD